MTLNQSALLELTEMLRSADGGDLIRRWLEHSASLRAHASGRAHNLGSTCRPMHRARPDLHPLTRPGPQSGFHRGERAARQRCDERCWPPWAS